MNIYYPHIVAERNLPLGKFITEVSFDSSKSWFTAQTLISIYIYYYALSRLLSSGRSLHLILRLIYQLDSSPLYQLPILGEGKKNIASVHNSFKHN